MNYVAIMQESKILEEQNSVISKLDIIDNRREKIMEFTCLETIKNRLKKGNYKMNIVLDIIANKALGRFDSKYMIGDLVKVVNICFQDKYFKVGNYVSECNNDILLGLSDNGLGRINKSVTANQQFLDFLLKVGSKNVELIVK